MSRSSAWRRLRSLHWLVGAVLTMAPGLVTCPIFAANEPVVLHGDGRSVVYLDLTDDESRALGVADAVGDFVRCFELMTGHELPRVDGKPVLFDPTHPEISRFECRVTRMQDRSRVGAPNAQVGLVLSPQLHFERSPFAGPGEKVGWVCTWDRPGRKLTFRLTVANQPYYGPGYGPFTFATLQTEAPDYGADGSLRLALEMRGGENGGLRGSYSIDGRSWVSTDWFDPTLAGTDTHQPGESDKNGPQAWKSEWQERWKNKTAFYVTAYHPKDRQAVIAIDEVRVTRDGQVLFSSEFLQSGTGRSPIPDWTVTPAHGTARVANGAVVLEPQPGGWNTIGLRARAGGLPEHSSMKPLRVELTNDLPRERRFDARLVQGFEIEAGGEGLVLRARTPLGLQNALYYLLHYWGCRWVMPGELGECIPERAELTFPAGVVRFAPFADTALDVSPFRRWCNRNLGGWDHRLSGQHYWFYAIPPKEHFTAHPKWFSLLGGRRQPRQLCTTNPEVIARMIQVAKNYLRRSPTAMSFPMDPNDNLDFCQCDRCRALDPPGLTTRGAPSVTDRVLTFVNSVADGIRDEFPDRYVAFYAYATHLDPPVRVKPAKNVIVIICRSGNCLLHLTPTPDCPTSDFAGLVRRWRALTPNVYGYEYDPISWTGGLPCPTYLEMTQSLKDLFTREGMLGSYSDGTQYAAYASTYINRYLARRMKVDPTQDPSQVLRDMCQHFFGPASEPMERYYRELAKVTRAAHAGRARVGGGSTFYHDIFSPEIVQNARRHLDAALAQAQAQGREVYQRRVAMVNLSQQYLEAYLDGVWSAQARQYERAVAAFERMDALIDEMAAPGFIAAADAHRRARTMRMKTMARHFPKRLGFVTRWKLLGPFDNSDRNADLIRDSFEPIASIDRPVALADGARADWWEYQSPGGFLNLEKAFADKPKGWELSYAFAGTTFQTREPVSAQLRMDSFFPFRVFVDGKEVYYRPGLDADCPDKRMVDVRLAAGTHTIVFKLSQTRQTGDTFPWGLYFRVVVEGQDAVVFPVRWAFRRDPDDAGRKQKWWATDLDDTGWRRIVVPSRWEDAVGPYDGLAWYRVRFRLAAALKGKPLLLKFWGVDEQAWVYWNGEYVGERTTASTGKGPGDIWDQPFELAVPPERVRWGQENVLAVRVHDSAYAGGIFRSVRLLIDE